MATKRSTFQKRQREVDLKDKARAKEARRAAKRDDTTPNSEADAAAKLAQEAEIAAAIAEATAAAATIAHDTRRAGMPLPSTGLPDSASSAPSPDGPTRDRDADSTGSDAGDVRTRRSSET